MQTIKTNPVDEHTMDMVGHCCGGRFPILGQLDDGIDFSPSPAARAEMEKLQSAACAPAPAAPQKSRP